MRLAIIAALSLAAVGAASLMPAAAQDGAGMFDRLMAADANNDGAITRAEMRAVREASFRRVDADNDGFITEAERQRLADAAAAKGKGKGGGAGDRAAGGADTNNDGKISREEFLNTPMRGFDRLDANSNDVIDAAELERAKSMMARRKQVTP